MSEIITDLLTLDIALIQQRTRLQSLAFCDWKKMRAGCYLLSKQGSAPAWWSMEISLRGKTVQDQNKSP